MSTKFVVFREFVRAALFQPKSAEFKKVGLFVGFPGSVAVLYNSKRCRGDDELTAVWYTMYGVASPWCGVYGPVAAALSMHVVIPYLYGPLENRTKNH